MAYIEIIILLSVIGYLLYKLGTKNFDYFEKRKIPYEKPVVFAGNTSSVWLRKKSFFYLMIDLHLKFKSKFYGIFNMTNPQITIKDTDLIKQIFVKDFDHFSNHYVLITEEDDPMFGSNLVSLKDQKWKDMRATLSPAFTGSKLRFMFELIRECSQNAIDYVENEIKKCDKSKNDGFEIDGKDFFRRYTHNVIASCAFGLKVNSYRDQNNEFYKKSQKAVSFSFIAILRFMIYTYAKSVAKFFGIQLLDKEFKKYFVRLVMDTISFRLKNNIFRPDMINLLLEARKAANELKENNQINSDITKHDSTDSKTSSHIRDWTDEELVAQCFLFFLAGFETSSNLMCFASMELLANPDVQTKLYDEIKEVIECAQNNDKKITFEDIQKMKYLDMVISETLRKWPTAVATDRVCNKSYTIKDEDNEVKLEPGDLIWVNIVGLHHDPENFERPNIFDPERFNDENKINIKPFTYMPFGIGPRACIGMRLALIQAKMILFNLVSKFEIKASEKTILPLEIDPKSVVLQPKGGFTFKLKLRDEENS